MKVKVKQPNGYNFKENKLYTVIKCDWEKSTMTVIDDLNREVNCPVWAFEPQGEEFEGSVCVTKQELLKLVA